jgi:type II secretory pathway pseudopilin PulG
MNLNRKQANHGFSPIELIIVVACLLILAALLLPALARAKGGGSRVNCVNNLKGVGLAFRTFALDSTNSLYPPMMSTTNGGTLEFVGHGKPWTHFAVMSNELSTPKILMCPTDTGRISATTFALGATDPQVPFNSNSQLSYFVGVDADERFPNQFLTGDRFLGVNGGLYTAGLHSVVSNTPLEWVNCGHGTAGNIGLADGSVQQVTVGRLRESLNGSGTVTNRLEFP